MLYFNYLYVFAVAQCALALRLNGVIQGIPQEAIDVASKHHDSPIVNGLNFQSRFDIKLMPISDDYEPLKTKVIPVSKDYSFYATQLREGEYDLAIESYDFVLKNPHYRVIVTDKEVQVYESYPTQNGYNASSKVVANESPLVVQVLEWKEYYESPLSKLKDMVMGSPLGFIFKNTFYTSMFVGCLLIMVAPYVLSFIAPELSEQISAAQEGALSEVPATEKKAVSEKAPRQRSRRS